MNINRKTITIILILIGISLLLLTPSLISADVVNQPPPPEEEEREEPEQDANLDQPDTVEDYEPEVTEFDDEGKLNDPFDVEVTIGTQSAWNKKIPMFVTVTPKIDASRTEIRWDSGYGVTFEPDYKNFFPMAKGEEQTFKATLTPKSEGVYTVTASVTDWGYGRNYVSSDSLTLKLNEDLITDPQTSGYTTGVIIKWVIYIVLFIILIIVGIIFGRILYRWLKEWLKPLDY